MRFGIYFYPWYCAKRWQETPRILTSSKGEYDSTCLEVVRWQVDHLAGCGFDYVILELVPVTDWGFLVVDRAITQMIPLLRKKGIRWSFLLDAYVAEDRTAALPDMRALVRHIETRGWTDGLIEGTSGRPLLSCFHPVPDVALALTRENPGYELRFPVYFPHWGNADHELDAFRMTPWKECQDLAREEGTTLFDALVPRGYVSFYETTPDKKSFDGYAAALPAYDDRHQHRHSVPPIPVIPAENGATIRRELTAAAATGAEHIVVYGWNEYFENAVLEPTREQGTLLVDACREAMARLRSG